MIFTQIAIISIFAAILGMVLDRFKQPTILAYLLAGVATGYWGIVQGADSLYALEDLGKIGVVLLLFLVGMELSVPKVKSVGKAAFYVGMGQVLFTVTVGWLLCLLLGFNWLTSLYLSVALAFSSTIVIVKLLSEQKEVQSLHGRIAVGFLLVQDLVAILMLVVLSSLGSGELSWIVLAITFLKAAVMVAIVWWLSVQGIPTIINRLSPSAELLFLSSVAWGIGLSALMVWEPIGFSVEAGGFLAGITLANTRQHYEIFSRLRPLRDFFVMLFFVVLAVHLMEVDFSFPLWIVGVLSLFVLIGNPLIVMLIMKLMGYRARTGFLVSLAVAQISEFSLIVIALGRDLGQFGDEILGITTLVAVVTMTVSTYFNTGSHWIWKKIGKYLHWFDPKNANKMVIGQEKEWSNHIVLIGCHRTGKAVLDRIRNAEQDIVVMDHDPEVAADVAGMDIPVVYGDLEDVDVYETAGVERACLVVSTVLNYDGTLTLLEYLKNHNNKRNLVIIVSAAELGEAEEFYKAGADYVSVPRFVSGMNLGSLVAGVLRKDTEKLENRARIELDRLRSYLGYA